MKKKTDSQSGLFLPRSLTAFVLCNISLLLTMFTLAKPPTKQTTGPVRIGGAFSNMSNGSPSMPGPTTNLSNGITFDHATWNDPIRMVGEPDIAIDSKNGIYVSGPGGSTTQASWFWKSSDHGVQWHLIGCPLKSNCQNGGGDTEIVIARNNDVFASDLQTLTCNSALHSTDEGATWLTSEGCFPGTDRQWMGVFDPSSSATGRRIYLSANGQTQGAYFLVSTDNGTTYLGTDPINNPTAVIDQNNGDGAIGRFAVNKTNGHIYVPGDSKTWVSTDGGVTFAGRPRPAGVQGNLFASLTIDTAGNLYQAWIRENIVYIAYSRDEAQTWSTPLQISTGPASPQGENPTLNRNVMPWPVAGDPGRVAVAWYGTTDNVDGSTGPGSVDALWHVYVALSTNALDANPGWTQVQADEHPMHRGQICTGGTGCAISLGDRSLADFFEVDIDTDGRLLIAYNENSDLSLVVPPSTYIGKPINAVIRQRTGPSLFAAKGNLLPYPAPANLAITNATVSGNTLSVTGTHGLPPGNWAGDPAGDASFPIVPVESPNHPALDILEASVGDNGSDLTFVLKMADLSATAMADALTTGGTPAWMVTWFEAKGGVGPSMTSGAPYSHWYVKWLGQNTFVYGMVSSVNSPGLGAPAPKVLTYVPSGTASGSVNGNLVTISVPLANLGPLVPGDKIDHVIAYSLVEHADSTVNDWADQVKSFSYVIGTPAAKQHLADGYVQVSTDGFATSTLATLNNANNTWTAALPSANSGTVCARQVLAKDLYAPLWDDVQAGPTSCANFSIINITSAVSRKTHGNNVGDRDIDLPLFGTPGIECRAGQGSNGQDHKVVVTFPAPITLTNASVTPGAGSSASTSGAPVINGNAVTVNLTGVTNAQTLTVNLLGVHQGTNIADVSIPMSVLLGDVNASRHVDAGDIGAVQRQNSQPVTNSNFREDVNASGHIDAGDLGIVQRANSTSLP